MASFICGAIVGIERERQDKPAGLRTLTLICVGSTVFTLASITPQLAGGEPGRIAAQIVTGVGFLGAGSILRERHGIIGLTTAASVWATAGVGIIVGAGFPVAGLALSLTIFATLVAMRAIEARLSGRCRLTRVRIHYQPEGGKTTARVRAKIDDSRGPLLAGPLDIQPDGVEVIPLTYCTTHRDHRAVLAEIAEFPAVIAIERVDEDLP